MKHNWEYKKFGEIATTITPNKKLDKSNYLLEGIYPIISQEECYISGFWNDPNDLTKIENPVVVFGDHSRVLKYIDFDFIVGADGVKIINPCKNIRAKFLYYYLKWLNIPSLGYSRHFKLLKEYNYPVPPLDMQERIVVELDAINSGIEELRKQVKDLDSLAQTLFYETFGDPISNPKDWPVKKLGKICEFKGGGTPAKSNPDFYTGNIPWASVRDMTDFYLTTTEFQITQEAVTLSATNIIPKGTIIISTHVGLGKICLLMQDTAINQDLKGLFFNVDIPQNYFVHWYKNISQLIIDRGRGATVKGVTLDFMKNISFISPPLALQEQFAKQIEEIEKMKRELEAQIAEAQTLLDSRMDYWFN